MANSSARGRRFNPAYNNAPLDFNPNRNLPPMAREITPEGPGWDTVPNNQEDNGWRNEQRFPEDNNRERLEDWRERDRNSNNIDWNTAGTSNSSNLQFPDSSTPAVLDPIMGPQPWNMMFGMTDSTIADPSVAAMMSMTFNQYAFPGMEQSMEMLMMKPFKEIIRCTFCVLYPPNPNAPAQSTRERPPGCKTVFVGGIPENCTEEIIRDVFGQCGVITSVRMSKKNFCHIRFEAEQFVDYAIFLSGYRMRIEDKTDDPNTGRLHVDFAQAKDDAYDYECNQRLLIREQRHRLKMEQDRLRPPSPPPVIHFSEHEAQNIVEKLKGDDDFPASIQVLHVWLERGDCNKRNAGTFYSMVQSVNSHVRRLLNERTQYEQELQRTKTMMQERMQGVLVQFGNIQKVFSAASHQKVWDHFTKPQRKNITMWKNQAEELKNAQLEEVLNERQEDEMELSDSEDIKDDGQEAKRPRYELGVVDQQAVSRLTDQVQSLTEQNDSLRAQLVAYKNEADLSKLESSQDYGDKLEQVKLLQQAMQGMQQQLLSSAQQKTKDESKIKQLESMLRDVENGGGNGGEGKEISGDETVCLETIAADTTTNSSLVSVSELEAKLIGLIGTFLHIHPFGASVDYIWSYLQKLEQNLRTSDVETLLLKFPTVFKLEFSGVGALLERKWTFAGFQNVSVVE